MPEPFELKNTYTKFAEAPSFSRKMGDRNEKVFGRGGSGGDGFRKRQFGNRDDQPPFKRSNRGGFGSNRDGGSSFGNRGGSFGGNRGNRGGGGSSFGGNRDRDIRGGGSFGSGRGGSSFGGGRNPGQNFGRGNNNNATEGLMNVVQELNALAQRGAFQGQGGGFGRNRGGRF